MKYAVISDVHGNINALTAVLKDAEDFGADKYIFAGDYCTGLPYPNEVINAIKNLKHKIAIQGNEDNSLLECVKQDQTTWTDGQFQTRYWCYHTLTNENCQYLKKLPKRVDFKDNGIEITVTHSSADIYGDAAHREYTSSKVAIKYQNDPDYSRDKLLKDIWEYANLSACFQSAIQSLSDGIYISGHTHVQWYVQCGNKVLINPGSCGLPLDGASGAPYTILDIKSNHLHVEERRASYDINKLKLGFQNSNLFKAAPVWSGVILREMTAGFEAAQFFLQFVNDYANRINDSLRPYSIKTWTEAYNLWKQQNFGEF